jgi:hypothetical protein
MLARPYFGDASLVFCAHNEAFQGRLDALRGTFRAHLGHVGNVLRCFLAAKTCASLLGGVSRQRSQVLAAQGVLLVSRLVRRLPGCQRPELCQVLPYCNCWLHMHLGPIMSGWGRVETLPQLGKEPRHFPELISTTYVRESMLRPLRVLENLF